MEVQASQIAEAQKRLREFISPSPLVFNPWLSASCGCEIYLKLESMLPVGSFKIRGALNCISQLTDEQKSKGVLASSAGNHAQGVAWASRRLKVSATIFMPEGAPLVKVENTRRLGAEVILEGKNYQEAYEAARLYQKEKNQAFIHPYQDPHTIAGQGTIGLEIMEQEPNVDFIIGSIGGGGLMSGIGLAIKDKNPDVKVIGCQASGANPMIRALKLGQAVKNETVQTFADGIAVSVADEPMRKILSSCLDASLEANEDDIAMAVLHLLEKARIVAEGAGALPLAVLSQLKDTVAGKKVVLIISGGNIDVNILSRILDAGLVRAGRRIKLRVVLEDQPGSLSLLTQKLAENGANVLQAIHDRDKSSNTFSRVSVGLTLETRGPEHGRQVIDRLKEVFKQVEISK